MSWIKALSLEINGQVNGFGLFICIFHYRIDYSDNLRDDTITYRAQTQADHHFLLTLAIYDVLDAMPLSELSPDAETRVHTEAERLMEQE